MGVQPKSLSRFRDFIKDLERTGLIVTEIKSYGRGGGVTLILKPTVKLIIIREIVKKSIEKYF